MSNKPQVIYCPLNAGQRKLSQVWESTRIAILHGPAGTGKTHAAIGHAVTDMLERGRRLMLARPLVTCDEEIGFLPGTLEEKLGPWMGAFSDVLGNMSKASMQWFTESDRVEFVQVGMLRGRTVQKCTLIIDEAQNLTESQLRCVLTRVGRDGRIVLSGDPTQSDIGQSELANVAKRIASLEGVSVIRFDEKDQMRDPLVNWILSRI